jgi:putative hydrolase of the HAD superfamily
LARHGVPASRAIMVEDNLENLKTAHKLGLRTVWIAGPVSQSWSDAPASATLMPRARAVPSHVHLRVHSVLNLQKHCHARLF